MFFLIKKQFIVFWNTDLLTSFRKRKYVSHKQCFSFRNIEVCGGHIRVEETEVKIVDEK